MSDENVEAVRRIFAAWSRGNFSDVDWADPEIVFRGADDRLYAGEHRGVEAMARQWADWLHTMADFRVEALEYFGRADQVVTFNRFSGTGKASGVPLGGMAGACRFALRDQKIVELELYTDRKQALRDAGLED